MYNCNFKNYIFRKAEKVYGNDFKLVKDRIAIEIAHAESIGLIQELLIAEQLVKSYKNNRTVYSIKGSIGALCISYILGITQVDPIKNKIPYEIAFGLDGHKVPQLVIEHDGSGIFNINHNRKLVDYRTLDGKVDYSNLKIWDLFSKGNYPPNIGLDSEDTRKVLKSIKPHTIIELAKSISIALSPGLFRDNGEILVIKGIIRIQELPSTKEDFIEIFTEHAITKEVAYSVLQFIQSGRKIPKRYNKYFLESTLPYWVLPLCEKIKYLASRFDSIQLSILAYNIASVSIIDNNL